METINKNILITGGSRGIGRAICKEFASKGYTVLFTYISNHEMAVTLESEIENAGYPKAYGYKCDMSNLKEVVSLMSQIRKNHKAVEAVVNNVGILGDGKPFLMSNDDGWWNVVKTNVSSVTNTCRAVLPIMISQKQGKIINITSLSGQKGNPGQSAYSASKSAIVTFTRALAKEVSQFGITLNCVSPGFVETDMTKDLNQAYYSFRMDKTPLKRKGDPEEVANLVSYLVCNAPTYILGQEITIDGGLGLF